MIKLNLNILKQIVPWQSKLLNGNNDVKPSSANKFEQSKTMNSHSHSRLNDEDNSFEKYRDNSLNIQDDIEIGVFALLCFIYNINTL